MSRITNKKKVFNHRLSIAPEKKHFLYTLAIYVIIMPLVACFPFNQPLALFLYTSPHLPLVLQITDSHFKKTQRKKTTSYDR